jgi:preprotein translocase subunit YajC
MTALIAQAEPAPAGGGQAAGPGGSFPLLLFVLMGVFFLVVMLPAQRRQKREQAAMLANVKRGAKVVTSAGIIGTVVGLKDNEDEMTIRSEDTKLKVLKSTVVRVLGQEEGETK